MTTFFQFLFFKIYNWTAAENENGARGTAVFAVAGLQTFNILSLLFLYAAVTNQRIDIPKWPLVILYVAFSTGNYFLYVYSDKRESAIQRKWERVDIQSKVLWAQWLVSYIDVSVLLLLALTFLLASRVS